MKKIILFIVLFSSVSLLIAQRNYTIKDSFKQKEATPLVDQRIGIEPVKKEIITQNTFVRPAAPESRDLNIFAIGSAANAYSYGYGGGQRTILWADDNLNTFVNFHRMTADTYSGNLSLDISYDRGETFSNNNMIYESTEVGGEYHYDAGRYPQGAIYNPPGNTDPANAWFTHFCPTTRGSNGGTWGGYCYGVSNLVDFSDTTKHVMDQHDEFFYNVPDGFALTTQGTVWVTDVNTDWSSGSAVYNDALVIQKGDFNTASNDYEYEEFLLDFPTLESSQPAHTCVAFASDGMTGYIVGLADDGSVPFSQGAYYPIVVKTTDGGESWEDPVGIEIGGPDGISEIVYDWLTDDQIEAFFEPPAPDRDEILYTTAFDCDIVIDVYGNPHIAVVIGIGSGEYSIYTPADYIAVFDIFSFDGGETWHAYHLGTLTTFRGTFGDLTEDNRVNASVTMDGTIIAISWLDTHFEGMEDNNQPDIFCAGVDPVNNKWTEPVNVTEFTDAWLQAYFFVAPYYMFTDGDGEYTIPFTYEDMDPNDPLAEVQYMFIQDYKIPGDDFIILGISDQDIFKTLIVSQNYPNPFNDQTTIDVEMKVRGKLEVDIYNLIGQSVVHEFPGVVEAGKYQFVVSANDLKPGIYFYIVRGGGETRSGKMVIE